MLAFWEQGAGGSPAHDRGLMKGVLAFSLRTSRISHSASAGVMLRVLGFGGCRFESRRGGAP